MSHPQWTVMLYMAAGDDQALDAHAIRDLQEIERGLKARRDDAVKVIVQINRAWPPLPQRYEISRTGSRLISAEDITSPNMAAGESLATFLEATLGTYRSTHYFLVLWGHAYGLGFGRDHGDALKLAELRLALDRFRKARRSSLELLGANACAMSYAEAAFELRGAADYLVASQIAVPFAGWPYESILKRVGAASTPRDFGALVVDSYVNSFAGSTTGDQVAMTLLDLQRADELERRVTELTASLAGVLEQPGGSAIDRLAQIRTAFLATAAGDVRPLIDVVDLCEELEALCTDMLTLEGAQTPPSTHPLKVLATAAKKLHDFATPAVTRQGTAFRSSGRNHGKSRAFVLFHKSHPALDGLHGLGIFAPFVTHEHDLLRLGLIDPEAHEDKPTSDETKRKPPTGNEATRTFLPPPHGLAPEEYRALALVSASKWSRLVYDDLREALPDDVTACVDGTGAANRAERAAVVQMLASIDSMFDKLDRTVAAARRHVEPALDENPTFIRAVAAAGVGAFGALELMPPGTLDKILEEIAKTKSAAKSGRGKRPKVPRFVEALLTVEGVVAEVERAAMRTLTHRTFGLGPAARSGGFDVGFIKSGFGAPGDKPQMGFRDKPQMGDEPQMGEDKPQMGAMALAVAETLGPAFTLVELFRQVGQALQQVETALHEVERTGAIAISGTRNNGAPLQPAVRRDLALRQVDRAFQVLVEASIDARRTMRRVLAHPLYGFGPGPENVGTEERLELARLGGLNSRELVLL